MVFKQIKKLKLKKTHQWRNSYISSNDKMNYRCLLKSTADAGRPKKQRLEKKSPVVFSTGQPHWLSRHDL